MKPRIVVALGLVLAAALSPVSPSNAQILNPIVLENQRPGSANVLTDLLSRYNPATIAGYADTTSVNLGKRISFKVSTSQPGPYTINVYRLGYYGGSGARLVASSGVLAGITQAPCPVTDPATRLIECQWKTSYPLNIGRSWISGIYMAKLIHSASQREYPIYFIVRDDKRRSDIVFQSARNTAL
ncbi:MAG TPA: N,N-dimethylformamidase beta subunit family domain-containing protein, partial [Steroidobacteraceae bacterium]|nr:N,N-dimethylformamidase beta subunit family domain-containing protein [Steroidobacteraceae bacterium]